MNIYIRSILITCLLLSVYSHALARAQNTGIVYGSESGWTSKHSAEELAKYIKAMTGQSPGLFANDMKEGYDRVFLIGDCEQNKTVEQMDLSIEIPQGDGFVIQSFKKAGVEYTVLAGRNAVSSMYAVYDYLERYCKVGFFEDGDFIPSLDELPFKEANTVQQPYFKDRHYLTIFGHWGLKKFHPQFWTFEEWKQELDFCAKKKINMSRMHFRCAIDTFRGDVATRAFPEIGLPDPGYSDSAGWPNTYNWPEEYRTELTKKILKYGRSLGIRFQYLVSYGDIPLRFKKMHPEIEYMPDNQYGPSTLIRPEDPRAAEVTKQYLRKLIETFGTDHMYFDTPYSEESPGATPQETLRLITDSSLNLCKVLKEVDPEAIWVWDSWTFTVADIVGKGEVWTDKNIQTYIDSLPTDMTYIFDNNSDLASGYPDNRVGDKILAMYEQHHSFYGKRWAFAVLHSYAGDDGPHGNTLGLIKRVQALTRNSEASNCVGFFTVPEKIGDNDLFWQLVLDLSWDPLAVDHAEFVNDYALRRFGNESIDKIAEGLQLIIQGAHSTEPEDMNYPYYIFPGYGQPHAYPIFTNEIEFAGPQYTLLQEKIKPLYSGLELILAEKDCQEHNPLYENTVVEYGKHYFAQLCNSRMLRTLAAFVNGDSASFEQEASEVMDLLQIIERILASRDDYLVKHTIQQAMSVPGTNPATPKLIRQNMSNGNYMLNDNYEQMRMLYRPRVNAWIARMRARINSDDRTITWSELYKDVALFEKNWVDGPLFEVPQGEQDILLYIKESLVRKNNVNLGELPVLNK